MHSRFLPLLVVVFTSALPACGGGGGSGGGTGGGGGGGPTPPTVLTGYFIDAAVAGLTYSTPSRSGVTNVLGAFNYLAGEMVTFSIGSIVIGSAMGAEQITPFSFFDLTPPSNQSQIDSLLNDSVAGDFDRVINIASFLIALDADDNPDNGIDLTGRGALLASASLDFNVDNASFRNTSFPSFLATYSLTGTSWQTAIAHLYSSLDISMVNALPSFTSGTSGTALENAVVTSYIATATDADSPNLSFSLTGGADAIQFSINSSTGVLRFVAAPDFESPQDANANNVYEVIIQVGDGSGGTATINVSIEVLGVNEPPSITSPARIETPENSNSTGLVVTAIDPDGDLLSFGIVGGADQAKFSINSSTGALSFITPADFENPADNDTNNIYEITIEASDGHGEVASQAVSVVVTDAVLLSVHNSYPTPNANLGGGVTDSVVTGYVEDLEDNEVLFSDNYLLYVNGVPATFLLEDASRWQADIPVSAGGNNLLIQLTDSSGHSVEKEQVLNNSNAGFVLNAVDFALDSMNQRALVLDLEDGTGALIALDLTTGIWDFLNDPKAGDEVQFSGSQAIVYDSANNQAFVLAFNSLIRVDLNSGDRSVISDHTIGNGPNMATPQGIALDSANNRALVIDVSLNAVLGVNLSTGDRTILSDSGTGSGPIFSYLSGIIADTANNRALVIDNGAKALISVNLGNGNRTILSDATTGSGPPLEGPNDLALDISNNRVLIVDGNVDTLFAVDLLNGNRTVISDFETGLGIEFSRPVSIEYDLLEGRALVLESDLNFVDTLLSVDMNTGDRVAISGNSTGAGPSLVGPDDIALDSVGNRLLLLDGSVKALFSIDLETADRAVVSDSSNGGGIDFSDATGVVFDTSNNRAFVADVGLRSILSVDLTTGDRAVLSSDDIGFGTPFIKPTALVLDAGNGQILVVDEGIQASPGFAAVIAVNLSNGNRTIRSSSSYGGGPELYLPRGAALDISNNQLILVDFGLDAIVAVDLLSGDRTVLSDSSRGTGPNFVLPQRLALNLSNNQAFVVDSALDALIEVDLETGNRTILSNSNSGSDINFSLPTAIALDKLNRRVFITDADADAVIVVELQTGERAISSM